MGPNSVKNRIMSNEGLPQYFDRCMTLYKYFSKQSNMERQLLGIMVLSFDDVSANKSALIFPEDRYYDSNEWYVMSKDDQDKVLNMLSGRNVGKNDSKLGGYSKTGGVGNSGKWKSKISSLEKKLNNWKRQFSVFNTAAKSGLDNEDSCYSEKRIFE